MSAVLQGDLRFFPAAQLLPFLAEHAHSGTLIVSTAQHETRLFLHRGKLAWEEGNLEVLGVEEAVLELLGWREGTFTFVEDASLPPDRQSLDLEVQPLVEEGQRREREMRSVLELYPDDRISFRVAENPSDEISLTPAEFKLVFRIGRGETLNDLCRNIGRPPVELYPLIRNLEANGLISAVPAADEESTRTSPGTGATPASLTEPPPERDPLQGSPTLAGGRVKIPEPDFAKTLVGTLSGESGSGGMHPLLSDALIVGRDASNEVHIPDGSVSTKHARITRTPEGFVLEDLKSRNGTFVNGEALKGTRLLVDNDVIRFGRVVLTFNTAKEIAAGERTMMEKMP